MGFFRKRRQLKCNKETKTIPKRGPVGRQGRGGRVFRLGVSFPTGEHGICVLEKGKVKRKDIDPERREGEGEGGMDLSRRRGGTGLPTW